MTASTISHRWCEIPEDRQGHSRNHVEEGCERESNKCVGRDIVQADHAPEAGVAQGIFHGDLIRHQDRHQEELEEELEEEVERRVKREHSNNQKKCACMDDME